jgi:hypothetical protein
MQMSTAKAARTYDQAFALTWLNIGARCLIFSLGSRK